MERKYVDNKKISSPFFSEILYLLVRKGTYLRRPTWKILLCTNKTYFPRFTYLPIYILAFVSLKTLREKWQLDFSNLPELSTRPLEFLWSLFLQLAWDLQMLFRQVSRTWNQNNKIDIFDVKVRGKRHGDMWLLFLFLPLIIFIIIFFFKPLKKSKIDNNILLRVDVGVGCSNYIAESREPTVPRKISGVSISRPKSFECHLKIKSKNIGQAELTFLPKKSQCRYYTD